jgi:epoxyqueuosine reductase
MNEGMDVAYERLRDRAMSMGACLFGVADLDRVRADTDLLDSCYDAYYRGVSVGVGLDEGILAGINDGPTPEYVHEYLRANVLLDSIAVALVDELRKIGKKALRIPASEVIDWERLRGHLPHKLIGRYAGLGWIGKNILLVNPLYGARVRYVTVLTDAFLKSDSLIEEGCGNCVRCAVVCPAHAVVGESSGFNLSACFNKLAEFNELLGAPHFICGVCIKACGGRSAQTRS